MQSEAEWARVCQSHRGEKTIQNVSVSIKPQRTGLCLPGSHTTRPERQEARNTLQPISSLVYNMYVNYECKEPSWGKIEEFKVQVSKASHLVSG